MLLIRLLVSKLVLYIDFRGLNVSYYGGLDGVDYNWLCGFTNSSFRIPTRFT